MMESSRTKVTYYKISITLLLLLFSPREIRFFRSLRHPSHLPHQPQSHPPPQCSNHIAQIYIPDKGVQWKKVRYDMQPFHLHFLAILLICTLLVKHDNKTIHNNQTPRNNQSLDQLLKDQQRKKGKQWTAGNLSAALYICSLTFIMLLLKSIIPKQPNPNPTQQSATSQIENF